MTDLSNPPLPWRALTAGQADFYEEFQFHPGQPVSTVAHCIALDGPLDESAMLDALRQMVVEADVLATTFYDDGQSVGQRVDPAGRPHPELHDLRDHPDPEEEARQMMRRDIDALIDLRHAPLSAQLLLRVGDQRWLWYSRGHHIILDGFGMALIERRVAQLYAAGTGQPSLQRPLTPLAAFLDEDAAWPGTPAWTRARTYWRETLARHRDVLPVLRKGSETYGAAPLSHAFVPGADFEAELNKAAQRMNLSWPDLLTLLTALWLARHDPAREDKGQPLPVWLPYMSRTGSVSANVPAMVVNILPLIVPEGDDTLSTLPELATTLAAHRRHGRYRIEDMARDCGIPAGQRFNFTPLVNVMPFDPPAFAGVTAHREVLAAGPGDGFNVSFTADRRGAGLEAAIEADPATEDRELFPCRARALQSWLTEKVRALAGTD